MSYIVQKRHPSQQMQSIFHHYLIKMIVLHQLEQQGIPWEVFIAHEVFTNPQPHHQPNLPSSSQSPPSTPPSPPTDHESSPQENLPPSPSPKALDQEENNDEEEETAEET